MTPRSPATLGSLRAMAVAAWRIMLNAPIRLICITLAGTWPVRAVPLCPGLFPPGRPPAQLTRPYGAPNALVTVSTTARPLVSSHVGENETGAGPEFGGDATGFPVHIGNGDSAAAGYQHSRGGRPDRKRHPSRENLVIDIHGHTPHDAVIYSARVGVILKKRLGDPPCENPPNRLDVLQLALMRRRKKPWTKIRYRSVL